MSRENILNMYRARQAIENRLFDPQQGKRRNETTWDKAPFAKPLQELPSTAITRLFPASMRIERVAGKSGDFDAVIGGLCSVYTGDNDNTSKDNNLRSILKRVRMDQVVESVGIVKGKPTLVVVEDSLFARMYKLPQQLFQEQAEIARRAIERWTQATSSGSNLIIAKTSDIECREGGLRDAVNFLANEVLKNPDFARLDSAPVLVMYTSLWADLLTSMGYLTSNRVICVEPVNHFIADRRFPDQKLQNAFSDFLGWLKDQPYGKKGSMNEPFSIAGFTPSVSGDQSKGRTRLLPSTEVPNSDNYKDWIGNLRLQTEKFPFPLRNSVIFAEGVNWGMWNPKIVENLSRLIVTEDEYYSGKKVIKDRETSLRLKRLTQESVQPVLEKLAKDIGYILEYVLSS